MLPLSELGIGPKMWLSLHKYDGPATAKALPQPLLILQGGRDYQVTEKDDLALWKKALGGKGNVDFKFYPALNHVFFAGQGMATPTEYETVVGHVDPLVIENIAAWIAKH